MNSRHVLALSAALTLVGAPLAAQTVIRTSGGSVTISGIDGNVPPELLAAMASSGGAPAPAAAAAAPDGERAKQLAKLEYDRRPSAILEAWTTPVEPPEVPEVPEAAAATEPSARTEPAEAEVEVAAEESAGEEPSEEGTPEEALSAGAEDDEAAAAAKEAAKAAEAAAKEAAKAAEEAAKQAAAAALEYEMKLLQRAVTLGDWEFVDGYLRGLTEEERAAGYKQMLESLQRGPKNKPNVPQQGRPYLEVNRFSPADVLALAGAAPRDEEGEVAAEQLTLLGQILGQAFAAGHKLEAFLSGLRPRLDQEGQLTRRQLARMLVAAEQPLGLEGLLPSAEEAVAADDREALNLLARFVLARYAEDGKTSWLEQAWTVTLAALADGEIEKEAKQEALRRAVQIAPKLRDELGQAWLDESFSLRRQRGQEILAAIGGATALALQSQPTDANARRDLLELQATAAGALLAAAPELAREWRDELDLLAGNWLREAGVTYQFDESTSRGPSMQRDVYGNFFYSNGVFRSRGSMVEPIATGKMLDLRPGEAWLELVDPTLRPQLHMLYAQLLLKVGEEAEAFPYIESLAAGDPRTAKTLVDEFLRVWAKNHNPNEQSSRANQYVFFYGFEERANGIPLTRSKQERNLGELAEWVARLDELPVEVDDDLLVAAFKAAHSTAEVYRVETLERIFGSLAELDPGTLAGLMQQMRSNLAAIWRDPAVQEDKQTNRRQKDIQAEVLRGYELARSTIETALEDHPASWELVLARGALEHDENNYRQELKKDSEFAARRAAAFETFAQAAELYAAGVEQLEQDEESALVYETWFHAALGSCDLREIRPEQVLVPRQVEAVRDALAALPGERAERHVDKIASQLFARMSSLNPGVKFRYVREGLNLVGQHELAAEARALYDYYNDLVTEIQLRATLDGPDRVGNAQPFGLRLDLRHTAEIERESGGFAKYLQNQNSQNFGYNYGRPLEDYRDKFEEATREALGEHFLVHSVTFNEPTAHSVADAQYGWRVTPYAYVLLEARGPQVDSLPSLRLDLDFLDTSGYAVLPVESAVLAIDATAAEQRPFERLAVTQVLDERQASKGKLLLEVKAAAVGLVPAFESLFDLAAEGFEVVKVVDNGNSVLQFDEDLDGVAAERSWTVELQAREDLAALPAEFTFARAKVEPESAEYFRYVDADLASVEPVVQLERDYGEVSRPWLWWGPLVLVLAVAGLWALRRARPPAAPAAARFPVPDPLTPFSVLGFLRDIHERNGLDEGTRGELRAQIDSLERHYFSEPQPAEPELGSIAERWSQRAR